MVSGDFYWLENVNNTSLYAAAYCTGHGVPGAMVSVVCINALNRSVREFGLVEPSKILDKTRELVIDTFERSDHEVKDGMDISLCALNLATNELTWSGANNPLWVLRKGAKKLEETKADKQPIGNSDNVKSYTLHTIKLNEGDMVYTFTDGYQDQFWGPRGKKFKPKQLKKIILDNQELSMDEQNDLLKNKFKEWQGEQEQVDDVCVIGVKI